jgi:plastocyanin
MSRSRLVVAAAVISFGLAFFGGVGSFGSSADAATHPKSAAVTITIKNFMFSPMSIKVIPGEKVSVHNADSVTHTLSSSKGKVFSTGDIPAGATRSFRAPAHAGTYSYICDIHQFMHGTLIVRAG